jgi:hypothetical protein
MIIFSERKLAQNLHAGTVTAKQELYYLLLVNLFYVVTATTTFTHYLAVEKLTLYDYLEDIATLIGEAVTIVYAYFVNSKGDGQYFITRFICLTIPILIKTFLLILPIFVIVVFAFLAANENIGNLFIFLGSFVLFAFIIWRYQIGFKIASGQLEK